MIIKYYDIKIGPNSKRKDLTVFANLSKYRLFTPGYDYRLSSLWNGCKNADYHERYSLAVAYDKKIPVGVVIFEPDDKNFLSCFIKPDYRGKGLANKLAKIVVEKNNYPTIWCLGKSQSILAKIGYTKNSKNRKMEFTK